LRGFASSLCVLCAVKKLFNRKDRKGFRKERKGNAKTPSNFSHVGIETFPKDNPDLAKKNFAAGWGHSINISLKEYLEKP
jgi:hypothetical protein